MLAYCLLMPLLLLIFYYDLKSRAIAIVIFPILAVLVVYASLQSKSIEDLLFDASINTVYLLLLFGVLAGYVWLTKRKGMYSAIGIGDILLLLCLTIYFDPVEFILFNTTSLIVALLLHLILKSISTSYNGQSVPLAGFQSACFAVFLSVSMLDAYGVTG